MSVLATTSLSDSLPSSIPKLDASGVNWAIFSVRFEDAIEAKGFWSHFDGSASRPTADAVTVTDGGGNITTSPPSDAAIAAVDKWDKISQVPAYPKNPRFHLDAYSQQTYCSGKMGSYCHRIY